MPLYTNINFDIELSKRNIYQDSFNLHLSESDINANGSNTNSRTLNETNLDIYGRSYSQSSNPYGYQHVYPITRFGRSDNTNRNNVDDQPGTVKEVVSFLFWNRYRGDGTGWQISFGKANDSACKMQFFADAANGKHNRMRFQTIAYDQDQFVQSNSNTWIFKDHNTLNLWGSGHVSIGEHFDMATDGANNGTASDLNKPKYHLSIQNGLGVGNDGSNFLAKLHVKQNSYDIARGRFLFYTENSTGTRGLGIDPNCNLTFGTSSQYLVFYDQALALYKKARINNGAWEITNY